MVFFLNILVLVFFHLSVYFVTRRHEKQIKCKLVSQQAAEDFAKEKKALQTTRIIIMALFFCLFPLLVYVFLWFVFSKGSSYTGNVIVLSQPVFIWLSTLNSLCNPIIYCYRNKMIRKTCMELLGMKCINFNED